jgi:hypothetical protein
MGLIGIGWMVAGFVSVVVAPATFPLAAIAVGYGLWCVANDPHDK